MTNNVYDFDYVISYRPYSNIWSMSTMSKWDKIHQIEVWLRENVGDEFNEWAWNGGDIGVNNKGDAIALKLKFGL